jgi:plasmid stabilization system protein ParE
MAKRIIWTNTAKQARRDILQYWINHNKSKAYSKKLSILLREKISLIKSQNYIGKPTDFEDVRATLISHFTIFYKITPEEIIIVGIWDNRRNPEDLLKNLEF